MQTLPFEVEAPDEPAPRSFRASISDTTQATDASTELVHGSYWPTDVRAGDGVHAEVCFRAGETLMAKRYRVWRISPIGADFCADEEALDLKVGTHVDVALSMGGQSLEFNGLTVCSRREAGGRVLFGVRWKAQRPSGDVPTPRSQPRWTCSNFYAPTGVATNPMEFNDLILFRVADVSRDGMRLLTSMRNKFIIPGTRLDAILTFPLVGSAHARFTIRWIDITSQDNRQVLAVGAEFMNPTVELLQALGQYTLQFGSDATVEEVRGSGLKVKQASKAVSYTFVRSEKDYLDVLGLRREAYVWLHKLDPATDLGRMADVYDSRARILMARHHGRCVGSLRMIFHGVGDKLEQEEHIELPKDFPRKDETVEVTRICTHPEYRRSDLFYDMIKHCAVALLQANRRWLVGSTTKELRPLYERLGAWILPVSYRHPEFADVELQLVVCDILQVVRGIGVNPYVWNMMAADVLQFASARNLVEVDTLTKVRTAIYRMLAPVYGMGLRRARKEKRSA